VGKDDWKVKPENDPMLILFYKPLYLLENCFMFLAAIFCKTDRILPKTTFFSLTFHIVLSKGFPTKVRAQIFPNNITVGSLLKSARKLSYPNKPYEKRLQVF